jgi:hypothetical protein
MEQDIQKDLTEYPHWDMLSGPLPRSGTLQSGTQSKLQIWERPRSERESLLLPTPMSGGVSGEASYNPAGSDKLERRLKAVMPPGTVSSVEFRLWLMGFSVGLMNGLITIGKSHQYQTGLCQLTHKPTEEKQSRRSETPVAHNRQQSSGEQYTKYKYKGVKNMYTTNEVDYSTFPCNQNANDAVKRGIANGLRTAILKIENFEDYIAIKNGYTKDQISWVKDNLLNDEERKKLIKFAESNLAKNPTPDQQIIIDPEFEKLFPPLSQESYLALEKNILADGCREPLVVWKQTKKLIDGHHRLSICKKNNIPYTVILKSFGNRTDVLAWIIENQFGRRNANLTRNLNPIQKSYLRGVRYTLVKKDREDNLLERHKSKSKEQKGNPEVIEIATYFNVSPSSLSKDGKLAMAINACLEFFSDIEISSYIFGEDPEIKLSKRQILKLGMTIEQEPAEAKKLLNSMLHPVATYPLSSYFVGEAVLLLPSGNEEAEGIPKICKESFGIVRDVNQNSLFIFSPRTMREYIALAHEVEKHSVNQEEIQSVINQVTRIKEAIAGRLNHTDNLFLNDIVKRDKYNQTDMQILEAYKLSLFSDNE